MQWSCVVCACALESRWSLEEDRKEKWPLLPNAECGIFWCTGMVWPAASRSQTDILMRGTILLGGRASRGGALADVTSPTFEELL